MEDGYYQWEGKETIVEVYFTETPKTKPKINGHAWISALAFVFFIVCACVMKKHVLLAYFIDNNFPLPGVS